MTKHKDAEVITEEQVRKYDLLNPLLHSTYAEMKELSAKKQDLVLNRMKVTMINRILRQIRDLLAGQPTVEFIELLDEETLPTNSDAVLALAQFMSAMHQFHERYHRKDPGGTWSRWHTTENP